MQIEFLNSVIVDLQRKNQEVTLRLQAMEESGICDGLQDGYVAVTPSSRSGMLASNGRCKRNPVCMCVLWECVL